MDIILKTDKLKINFLQPAFSETIPYMITFILLSFRFDFFYKLLPYSVIIHSTEPAVYSIVFSRY